jgi:hypothetical protein
MRRTESRGSPTGPDQRLREVAEILAGAVIRLRLRAALPDSIQNAGKTLDSPPNCLEVPSETRLSVHGS